MISLLLEDIKSHLFILLIFIFSIEINYPCCHKNTW